MKWYRELYVGDKARRRQGEIVAAVSEGRQLRDVYLLTLPCNPVNTLEIVPAWTFRQKMLRDRTPMVIGLADGYREALALTETIIADTCRETGGTRVCDYISGRESL